MAHFAQLDENGVVLQVVVISNAECKDPQGIEREAIGAGFCSRLFGGTWLQTSYNESIRKNFAGVGYTYDKQRDAFIPPAPFPSWVLDENTCRWYPPVPMPTDDKPYVWDEETISWKEVNNG